MAIQRKGIPGKVLGEANVLRQHWIWPIWETARGTTREGEKVGDFTDSSSIPAEEDLLLNWI